ncbi:DUF6049 family protein [Brachybacterium saurashtrense]|uniref:DUF6049 family protein n=1 Tax=Brachybacterium saurashtrense TaxID=556288 RepID=UPI0013B3D33B|nr:DUF6049 family protein [Brachybacterium saurashtrense]
MPSSPLSVRPVLAALLAALLVASSVLVSVPSSLMGAAHAAPPPASEDSPISTDLVSLTPTSLAPGGVLEAQVDVTNTSERPLSELALELRTRTARVTDREALETWQTDATLDSTGTPLALSGAEARLEPGETARLTVRIDADELGYAEASYYWGTRRIALTVTAEDEALSTLRTFVVWRPADADAAITQSVLLPVAAEDASAMVTDPEGYAESAESGRLASVSTLAQREDVDWWLDPALLDPPMMPVDGDAPADDGQVVRRYAAEPTAAALATTLEEFVGARTVLAMPYAQSDLVSLGAADADALARAVQEHGDAAWSSAGIVPVASALPLEGSAASASALEAAAAAGGTAAVLPSSSLREDPRSSITPSSVGVHRTDRRSLALLAPDPVLSDEFSLLAEGSDAEQTRQRLLAETATIASEYTTAPRHLLITPSAEAVLDPEAAAATLDAFEEAPWIETGRTSSLLQAAAGEDWTTDPADDSGALYALGEIEDGEIHPSAPDEDGRWNHLESADQAELLDPEALTALGEAYEQVDVMGAAMEDDAPLEAPRLEILAGTSQRWRGDPELPLARAQEASALVTALQDRIQVVPASGYNVISDQVSVPITLSNDLDTPITVRVEVTSDKPLVQVGEPAVVEVPARGQVDAAVDVEAIANGEVVLTTVVTTEDGRALNAPVDVPLTVNPSWENWTTLVLVIAMGLLVVVGVARARRTGSAARAPAVRGPEEPEEPAPAGPSREEPGAEREVWPGGSGPAASGAPPDPTEKNRE